MAVWARPLGADPFAYSRSISGGVSAWRINPSTGALTFVWSWDTGGASSGIAVHPSGRFLYAPSGSSNNIAGFLVHPVSGLLTPMTGSPFPAGNGAWWITLDPFGRFAYVSDFPSSSVSAYTISPITGALAPVPGSPFPSGGSVPSGSAVHPSAGFFYVVNWSRDGPNSLGAFSIDQTTGALTPLPGLPLALGDQSRHVAIDPSGRFLYVASGEVASPSMIYAFTIDLGTGVLTPMSGSPFAGGSVQPAEATIDASGQFLYVANATNG